MKETAAIVWLKKAQEDLNWTRANIKGEIYYGACFTAQQAVEKALKAFLLHHQKKLIKIHDVSALLEECILIDDSFSALRETVLPLVDYYVQVRYPDVSDFMDYSREDAKDALERATAVVNFIKERLGQKG